MPKVDGGGISPASMNAIPYSVPQNSAYRGFNIALNCGDGISNQCSGFFKADSVEAGASGLQQSNMPMAPWQRASIAPEISVPASTAYHAHSTSEKRRILNVLSSMFNFFSMNRKMTVSEFCQANGIHPKILWSRLNSECISSYGKKMIFAHYGVTHDDLKKSVSAISANVARDRYMDVNGKIDIDACDAFLQEHANAVIEADIQKYLSRPIDQTANDVEQDAWVMGILNQPPGIPVPAYTERSQFERSRVLTVVTCMFDFFPTNHKATISTFGRSNDLPSRSLFSRLTSAGMLPRGKNMISERYGVSYDDLKKSVSAIPANEVGDRYMDFSGKVNLDACDALFEAHANAIIAARIQK